ncbi:MAG: hypothetical protein LBN92_05375 [Treponema sp.]|jgi:hypothetical protein|nr:hypothetical protein [Treponema sp.]
MKKTVSGFLCAALLCCAAARLPARGTTETAAAAEHPEYLLCVSAFDVSELPAAQQAIGPILQRQLALELGRIHHRARTGEELSRYAELFRLAGMRAAAARLADKRKERDALIYQGLPAWKYRREIKRIDRELLALEVAFAKAETARPLIEAEPVVRLADTANFPAPPKIGDEESFLAAHHADAFIAGTLRLLYGRVYVALRIYTRGGSFRYQDETLFSPESMAGAADEINRRLVTAVAGEEPAYLTVNSDPADAQILVNGVLAARGQKMTLPPGPVTIAVSADEHRGRVENITLESGEEADYVIDLTPLPTEELAVAAPGGKKASVYWGALYAGQVPIASAPEMPVDTSAGTETETEAGTGSETESGSETGNEKTIAELEADMRESLRLRIPVDEYRYVRIETEDGLTGEAIVKGKIDGTEIREMNLPLRRLPGKDQKPVESARKKFYGAFGRFWIALPLAFFINGIAQTYANAYNISGNSTLYDNAMNSYYWSIGAWSLAGVFLAETIIRGVIYVRTSSREAIPLWE